LNGDWYAWSVNSGNLAAYKQAWIRFVNIARTAYPEAKIVFSPTIGSHSDVSAANMWPGDAYVDVVGVDAYDMWPSYTSQAIWDNQYMALDSTGSPAGVGSWLAFARAHGKPMSVPEWGIDWQADDGGVPQDNPLYIAKMHQFFADNAGTGAGQILYECYFNVPQDADTTHMIYPVGVNPNASAMYRSLIWGGRHRQPPTPVPPVYIGDLNNDRKVDVFDLSILLSKWGTNDQPPRPGPRWGGWRRTAE